MGDRVWVQVLAVGLCLCATANQALAGTPEVAIVMCEETYDWSWSEAHSSSHAAVGLAGLLGVPYDTLTLGQLLAMADPPYTSVWFSQCLVLGDASFAQLDAFLLDHVGAGGNIFMDGPIGIYRPDPSAMYGVSYRGMGDLALTLRVTDGGWYPLAGYTVHASDSDHPVARRMGLAPDAQISQGILDGTELVDVTSAIDPRSAVLLELASPDDPLRYPFLVATETDSGSRVVAIGAYGNYVGVATSFRNEEPSGYYENRVLPYLLEALHWLDQRGGDPIVGLQLSHAPMTAIGRLDGDWSNDLPATEQTFLYLLDLAKTTGLSTAYGVVSSFVSQLGWELFADGAAELERLGGCVGSHSHTHNNNMSAELADSQWSEEVSQSLSQIRTRLMSPAPPPVRLFINPGDTIESADYPRFLGSVDLFMSHGFETTVPYSSGVIDFGLSPAVAPTVIVNDTPAPDYQWLYLQEWFYSVLQASDYQAQILGYYQNIVRRGVLFNQMWHDYAIGGNLAPVNYPEAETVLPLFDVTREHLERNEVYTPTIEEVVAKFHIASRAIHTSSRQGDTITVSIDYAGVPEIYRAHVASMGLRIHRGTIAAVSVDGVDHPAFSRDTVILPQPTGLTQRVVVQLGQVPDHPRLGFINRPLDGVSRTKDTLTWSWKGAGLYSKSCVHGPEGTIILGADTYGRASPSSVCAGIPGTSTAAQLSTTVVDAGAAEFFVDRGNRPITAASIEGLTVTVTLADGPVASLGLRTGGSPLSVTVNGSAVDVAFDHSGWELDVPAGPATVIVQLRPCNDEDMDGFTDCAKDCDDLDPAIGICQPPGCCQSGDPTPTSAALVLLVVVLLFGRRGSGRPPGSRRLAARAA